MPFATLDGFAKKSVLSVQEYAILSGRAISNLFRHPRYVSDIFTQADIIGVGQVAGHGVESHGLRAQSRAYDVEYFER